MNHPNLRIQLLGEVRIRIDDGHHHLVGSGRRAAVLAVLALDGSASREHIVAAVWGADPPASANGNVYTHVNALRDVLGVGLLTHADGVYRLRVTEQAVDARRFEVLREQAKVHRAAGDLLAELAVVQDGLSLWAGEALAGVPGPFAEARRAHLHELRLATEQRHAEILFDLGRHRVATAELRPPAAARPQRNSLHRLLMITDGGPDETVPTDEQPVAVSISPSWTQRTRDVLRAVAFLGDGVTVDELCQVTGLPRTSVEHEIRVARAAEVLTTSPGSAAFRDPGIASALYDGTPEPLRATLHGFFAEMIADASGRPERVAAQLLRTDPAPLAPKASRWLLEHVGDLAHRSPAEAITLLQRAHLQHLSDRDTQVALSVWLARLLFGQGRDAVPEARWAAARTDDPDVQAEMLWIAASSHESRGRHVAAAEIARSTLSSRRHPQSWLDSFRLLILRLRLSLPGEPTEPRHGRTAVIDGHKMAAYRRAIAPDEAH